MPPLPDALPAALAFVFVAAAFLVAAASSGSGPARSSRPDPPGLSLTRLSRWDLLCFQPALLSSSLGSRCSPSLFPVLLFVKVLGAKNEETLLLQFPLCKKGDVIDLKMLAMHLAVREDLLSNFVSEYGFDVTVSQTLAAIEAMHELQVSIVSRHVRFPPIKVEDLVANNVPREWVLHENFNNPNDERL